MSSPYFGAAVLVIEPALHPSTAIDANDNKTKRTLRRIPSTPSHLRPATRFYTPRGEKGILDVVSRRLHTLRSPR